MPVKEKTTETQQQTTGLSFQLVIPLIFLISDMGVVFLSFRGAFVLRDWASIWVSLSKIPYNPAFLPLINMAILFTVGLLQVNHLYPGYGLTAVAELKKSVISLTSAFFLLGVVAFLNRSMQIYPRSIVFLSWVICLVFIPLLRFVLRNRLSLLPFYGVPIVMVGKKGQAKMVESLIRRARRLGWRPQGWFPVSAIYDGTLQQSTAKTAVLVIRANRDIPQIFHKLSFQFSKVILVWEMAGMSSMWIEPRDIEGRLGLEISYHLLETDALVFKRLIDLAGAILLILLLGPIMLLIAAFISIDSPGPLLFRQVRLARNGTEFHILKFRTMVTDAEKRLEEILKTDSQARAEYRKNHKLIQDPRITKVGKLLRRYSLDELPQLFNVVMGKMSLVGPRAYMPRELDEIGLYAPIILRVRPGMTGWWQVMGRHNTSFRRRLQMDEYYISNWSLWIDTYILLKTIWIVLIGQGE